PGLMRLLMKIFHMLPVSQLIDGSVNEIAALSRVFRLWREQAGIQTPHWDALEKQFNAMTREDNEKTLFFAAGCVKKPKRADHDRQGLSGMISPLL
ncbi:hypothetical protein BZG21_48255, partial [Escherichia coli]|nr:hypothetical protein [Escherichia coli]